MSRVESTRTSSFARLSAAGAALGLFAAAMWLAWLGWDHDYYLVDGVPQGPYRAWQVIGCGASICAAAVVAQVWARGRGAVVLAAAAAVGFAVPWSVGAASTDESGLWVVGLVLLLVGSFVGVVVLLTVSGGVLRRVRRPAP